MTYRTPFGTMNARNIGGMIEDLFQRGFSGFDTDEKADVPVNIQELDKGYELHLVAPGLKKEDFKVHLDRNVLTISFDAKEETDTTAGRWLRHEYKTRSFKRSFTLNDKIDGGNVSAKYTDGILVVSLPKREPAEHTPQEISIS